MIIKFENVYLEKLFTGEPLSGKPKYNEVNVNKFKKRILILKNLDSTIELSKFKSSNFEALKGEKLGLFSIRIDLKYQLEFRISNQTFEIIHIEELSKHYE